MHWLPPTETAEFEVKNRSKTVKGTKAEHLLFVLLFSKKLNTGTFNSGKALDKAIGLSVGGTNNPEV